MNDETTRCFFCNTPCGKIVCESDQCNQFDRELREDLERFRRDDVRKAVAAAIRQRCKPEVDWCLSRIGRWFYTLKCLLCVLLRRDGLTGDEVEVAQHHYAKLYAGWESRYIVVGRGIVCRWRYDIRSDGDWDM